MKIINKKQLANNFSKHAFSYDEHSAVQNKCAQELVYMINNKKYEQILEIGCGTGRFTQILRQRFPSSEIYAVDISSEMIKNAKKKGIGGNIKFSVFDAEELEKGKRYDLIVSNASFQWFNNMDGTIGKFKDMLVDRGMLCFSMYGPKTFCELKEVSEYYYGPTGLLSSSQFVTPEEIVCILKDRFRVFNVAEKFFTMEHGSLMDFLREIKNSGTRGEGLGGGNFLGKNSIIDMEKIYIQKFGRIKATHHVLFCEAYL